MVKQRIKDILLDQFISVDDPSELTDNLPLISGGILDSISILQLVDILEKEFKIEFDAHEIDRDRLDTVDLITQTVQQKQA